MEHIIIIESVEQNRTPKSVYKVSGKYDDAENYWITHLLEDMLGEYEYAYIGERNSVYGKKDGAVYEVLESLISRDNMAYLTDYTPEELWEEVADDWDSLAEYMFGNWVSGKSLEQAYKIAQEHGRDSLAEIMSAILGKKVSQHISRGYSQGEYAEAYIIAEDDEELAYIGSLFDAWAFGVFGMLEYVDENDEVVAEAIELDYTPQSLKGKTWEAKKQAVEAYILESVGLEKFIGKVGTAEAKQVYSWEYVKKEAGEK